MSIVFCASSAGRAIALYERTIVDEMGVCSTGFFGAMPKNPGGGLISLNLKVHVIMRSPFRDFYKIQSECYTEQAKRPV